MKKKLLFLGRIISYPLIDEKGNQWYLLLKQLFILLLSMFWGTNHSNIFGLGKFQTYTKVKKKNECTFSPSPVCIQQCTQGHQRAS